MLYRLNPAALVGNECFLKKLDVAVEIAIHIRGSENRVNSVDETGGIRRRIDPIWNASLVPGIISWPVFDSTKLINSFPAWG